MTNILPLQAGCSDALDLCETNNGSHVHEHTQSLAVTDRTALVLPKQEANTGGVLHRIGLDGRPQRTGACQGLLSEGWHLRSTALSVVTGWKPVQQLELSRKHESLHGQGGNWERQYLLEQLLS